MVRGGGGNMCACARCPEGTLREDDMSESVPARGLRTGFYDLWFRPDWLIGRVRTFG